MSKMIYNQNKKLLATSNWKNKETNEPAVAGVLQGDTLSPYLFIICLDYVLRTSINKIRENIS